MEKTDKISEEMARQSSPDLVQNRQKTASGRNAPDRRARDVQWGNAV